MHSIERGFGLGMKDTKGRIKKMQPVFEHGKEFDSGTENKVHQAVLTYKGGDDRVEGLLYKKPQVNDRELSTLQVEDALRKWDYLKEVAKALRENKQEGFRLPGTVRGYHDENGVGILVTDLSEGGKKIVCDLKEIEFLGSISKEAWDKIKQLVLQDAEIAARNGIGLDNGPSKLDPWLVVFEQDGPQVYLSDIGGYTSIYPVNEKTRDFFIESIRNIEEGLEKLERRLTFK